MFATAYYRGAQGILLVYDVTDEVSFNNIRNWMKNIQVNAQSNVNKVIGCAKELVQYVHYDNIFCCCNMYSG